MDTFRDWFDFEWHLVSSTSYCETCVRRNPVKVFLVTFAIAFGIAWFIVLALTIILSM